MCGRETSLPTPLLASGLRQTDDDQASGLGSVRIPWRAWEEGLTVVSVSWEIIAGGPGGREDGDGGQGREVVQTALRRLL